MTRRYYLRKDRIVAAIDANHLCQAGFAADIGLSRSHWSQVSTATGNRTYPVNAGPETGRDW